MFSILLIFTIYYCMGRIFTKDLIFVVRRLLRLFCIYNRPSLRMNCLLLKPSILPHSWLFFQKMNIKRVFFKVKNNYLYNVKHVKSFDGVKALNRHMPSNMNDTRLYHMRPPSSTSYLT